MDPTSQMKSLHYEMLDIITAELKRRFSHEALDIYSASQSILKERVSTMHTVYARIPQTYPVTTPPFDRYISS